jgi:hypothetical protein
MSVWCECWRRAQGKYMVLIDAHCKVYPDWLLPIRRMLDADHRRVVNMEVGELNATTWTHIEGSAIGTKAVRIRQSVHSALFVGKFNISPWKSIGDETFTRSKSFFRVENIDFGVDLFSVCHGFVFSASLLVFICTHHSLRFRHVGQMEAIIAPMRTNILIMTFFLDRE